jgi:hypothetical protein
LKKEISWLISALTLSIYTQYEYTLRFGNIIKVDKEGKKLIINKGFKLRMQQLLIKGEEIFIFTKKEQTLIHSRKPIIFSLHIIYGKCNTIRGNLKRGRIRFHQCRIILTLKNKIKIFLFSKKAYYTHSISTLILKDTFFTTCSLLKPHYKISAEKVYIRTTRDTAGKIGLDEVYIKNIRNPLLIPLTGFKRSFYLVKNGEERNVTFRGITFTHKTRFKRIFTLHFKNTFHPTKDSKYEFTLNPSYSTRRGFFIQYSHLLETTNFSNKSNTFYLNDKIENPRDEFEKNFFPPPTRNRYFIQSYGDIYSSHLNIKYEVYKLSDPNLLVELFPEKLKNEKQPESYLNIEKFFQHNFYFRLFFKPNINSFLNQTEYLPSLKVGILNLPLAENVTFTTLTSFSFLENNSLLTPIKTNSFRAQTTSLISFKALQEPVNLYFDTGILSTYYTNKPIATITDKTSVVGAIGLAKSFNNISKKLVHSGLFEIKYTQSNLISKKTTSATFFDKEDLINDGGELYTSLRNSFLFKHFEVEYSIFREIYTKKILTTNQYSFFPYEFPDNFNFTATSRKSTQIQDLSLKVGNFSIGTRYENSADKLFTTKPYLFTFYSHYNYKGKFIIRTAYNISAPIANAITMYGGIKLPSNYYLSTLITYYFNEHRIVNNTFALTKEFHDFYFGVNFSVDQIRKEVKFSLYIEPKFREKNLLEQDKKQSFLRR